MFDFVRTHSRLALGVMILLIFPSFVFFGIQGYSRFTGGGNETVAKVAGQTITRDEWDQAHKRNTDRLRRQMPNVDPKLLETPELRRETLDNLVRERVLMAAAREMHLTPDDARLQRLFRTDEQFANLRRPDGSLNGDLLAAQGMTPAMFEQQLRQEFAMQQVLQSVGQTSFATPVVAKASLDAMLQRREVQLQRFETSAYLGKVNPSDADIEAFYKGNQALFKAPELATIEYVVLNAAALGKDVAVAEADAQQFYKDNAARWTQPEERRASHILLKNEGDKQVARAQAEAVLAQLRKAHPQVVWQQDQTLRLDLRGLGRSDAAFVGRHGAQGVLAVAFDPGSARSVPPKLFRFAIDPSQQLGVCSEPLQLHVQPHTCERDAGPIPGCRANPRAQEIAIVGGDCDALHVFWNRSTQKLDWWRL